MRDNIHSEDVASFIEEFIKKPRIGEVYNIGNPNPEISMIELAETIKEILGTSVEYEIIDYPDSYPSDEPNRRCPSIKKAIEHINYNPSVILEEGLKRFFQWTNENYEGKQ